jgi:hypothetical protein
VGGIKMEIKYNLTGQKFGRLTVIKRVENRIKKCGQKQVMYLCKCDCGNEKVISYDNLKRQTRSCGCLHREQISKLNKKHGLHKTRIHSIWWNMLSRCKNKNVKAYKDYGGRGITVCDEWANDFVNFYNWAMENGYNDNLTIERIDVNKGYNPDNCKFISPEEQAHNKRNSVMITYSNETHQISYWANKFNISRDILWERLFVLNWSVEKALLTPVRKIKNKNKPIYQYDTDYNFIKKWENSVEIKNICGYNTSNIIKCCCGERNIASGYIWSFTTIPKKD